MTGDWLPPEPNGNGNGGEKLIVVVLERIATDLERVMNGVAAVVLLLLTITIVLIAGVVW